MALAGNHLLIKDGSVYLFICLPLWMNPFLTIDLGSQLGQLGRADDTEILGLQHQYWDYNILIIAQIDK